MPTKLTQAPKTKEYEGITITIGAKKYYRLFLHNLNLEEFSEVV